MNVQLLLLKIIKFNGDLTPLLKLGYEFSQIVNLIKDEVDAKNAQYVNGELSITKKGNVLIAQLSRNRKPGSDTWVEPEIASKITPIEKDFIYLPNRKELSF